MIHLASYGNAEDYQHPWIGISNSIPDWRPVDVVRKDLAPAWEDVEAWKAGRKKWRDFVRKYWQQLAALDAFADGDCFELPEDCTCLCWCGVARACHRRILAAWLVRRGYEVELDGVRIDETFRIGG